MAAGSRHRPCATAWRPRLSRRTSRCIPPPAPAPPIWRPCSASSRRSARRSTWRRSAPPSRTSTTGPCLSSMLDGRLDGQRMLGLRRELVLALHDAYQANVPRSEAALVRRGGPRTGEGFVLRGLPPAPEPALCRHGSAGESCARAAERLQGRRHRLRPRRRGASAPGYADMSKVSHWEVFGHQTLSG
jgi:hypothetical protein